MNLPETCQFCGAGVNERSPHGRWVTFKCYSWALKDNDPRHNQSQWCEKAERARLAASVAELEARCRRMEEIGDMIVDEYMVVEPEKSAWQQAKEAKP